MTEIESGSLFVHAMFNILLACADTWFFLNILHLTRVIEVDHPKLAIKAQFAFYPWLIILPMHTIYCLWTFIKIILLLCGCQR